MLGATARHSSHALAVWAFAFSPVHGACRGADLGPPLTAGSQRPSKSSLQPPSGGFSRLGFSRLALAEAADSLIGENVATALLRS
jgi:hypothetical protein